MNCFISEWDLKDFSMTTLGVRKVPVEVIDKSHLRHKYKNKTRQGLFLFVPEANRLS